MKWLLAAGALAFATPASAQYTITISGHGVYDPTQDSGDATDAVAIYGTSITYSSTFNLESGVLYDFGGGDWGVQYFGHSLSVTVNGSPLAVIGDDAEANFFVSNAFGGFASANLSNVTEPRDNDIGFAALTAKYVIPGGIINYEVPDLEQGMPYPPFDYVWLGGDGGSANYKFTLDSFSVAGTQPTITPYVPPVDPGDPGGAVPEPAAWAMMLGGFGIAGGMMRRKRVRIAYA